MPKSGMWDLLLIGTGCACLMGETDVHFNYKSKRGRKCSDFHAQSLLQSQNQSRLSFEELFCLCPSLAMIPEQATKVLKKAWMFVGNGRNGRTHLRLSLAASSTDRCARNT